MQGLGAAWADPLAGHPRYESVRVLGRGSHSLVQLCRDRATGEAVAVKLIQRGWDPAQSKYVERELLNHQDLSASRHPHIVEFREVFLTPSHLCVVMEYVEGENLQQFLANTGGRASEALARFLFQQLVLALDFCHRKGKVSRDVKLANTLLALADNQLPLVKLCDFGYSKDTVMHSAPASQVGTALFVAPEVMHNFSNRPYDGAQADVWSCGIVLFVLLFGRHPFLRPEDAALSDQQQMLALFTRTARESFTMLPAEAATISPECVDMLVRMLQTNPAMRITMTAIQVHPWFKCGLPDGAGVMNTVILREEAGMVLRQSPSDLRALVQQAAQLDPVMLSQRFGGGMQAASVQQHQQQQHQQQHQQQQQQQHQQQQQMLLMQQQQQQQQQQQMAMMQQQQAMMQQQQQQQQAMSSSMQQGYSAMATSGMASAQAQPSYSTASDGAMATGSPLHQQQHHQQQQQQHAAMMQQQMALQQQQQHHQQQQQQQQQQQHHHHQWAVAQQQQEQQRQHQQRQAQQQHAAAQVAAMAAQPGRVVTSSEQLVAQLQSADLEKVLGSDAQLDTFASLSSLPLLDPGDVDALLAELGEDAGPLPGAGGAPPAASAGAAPGGRAPSPTSALSGGAAASAPAQLGAGGGEVQSAGPSWCSAPPPAAGAEAHHRLAGTAGPGAGGGGGSAGAAGSGQPGAGDGPAAGGISDEDLAPFLVGDGDGDGDDDAAASLRMSSAQLDLRKLSDMLCGGSEAQLLEGSLWHKICRDMSFRRTLREQDLEELRAMSLGPQEGGASGSGGEQQRGPQQ
ncbi:sulfur stress regulator [Raphidocelis subcapitata]|uniref:Sulfur stress regulator n=1 Tax=Raphidocelis subcapitata TaxID=307507 RepID=A0A2V0PD39_9CHLO|nr:sulfur stress regulator [Raphidocelis subcapitata]|eukprot:GBF97768.1 sulfur stress regulator [Raphidocelis subcapitata]